MWPFGKREERSYENTITTALESAVADSESGSRSAAIAAVGEFLAAEIGGAMIEAPGDVDVNREVLAWLAREAVFGGEGIATVERRAGGWYLSPVADHDWQEGTGIDPEMWRCRVTNYTPHGSISRVLPRSRLVVLRWSLNVYSPAYGRGPAALAGTASKAASRSEARQADHGSTPVSQLLTIPEGKGGDGGEGDPVSGLKSAIRGGKGRIILTETTYGGWGNKADAPMRDLQPSHLGPAFTEELNEAARDSFDRMVAACGLPPALFRGTSDGTSLRESMRQARLRVTEPLRLRLQDELRMRLDPAIALKCDPYALDMVSRSQTVQKLAAAGVALPVAMAAVGMGSDGEI